MVMLRLVHVSKDKNKAGIEKLGLVPHKPTEDGNYVGEVDPEICAQPRAVYVCLDNGADDRDRWRVWYKEDVWVFPWIDQMEMDPWFNDGVKLIIRRTVPKEVLTTMPQ